MLNIAALWIYENTRYSHRWQIQHITQPSYMSNVHAIDTHWEQMQASINMTIVKLIPVVYNHYYRAYSFWEVNIFISQILIRSRSRFFIYICLHIESTMNIKLLLTGSPIITLPDAVEFSNKNRAHFKQSTNHVKLQYASISARNGWSHCFCTG